MRPSALHTFDYGQPCKSEATPTHLFSEILGGPILKRLPWSVTCLSPKRQGELLATQNPDGSLVFSAVLKDEQGLLSFLLVPPSPGLKRARAKALKLQDAAPEGFPVHVCGILVLPTELVDTREHWRNNLQICNLWKRLCCGLVKLRKSLATPLSCILLIWRSQS